MQLQDNKPDPDALDNEGMTQLRGSSNSEQDKFRITVDLEQACLGFFDETVDPKAVWGITSIILVGAHFRLENVDKNRCWKKSEIYTVSGEQKTYKAGTRVPGSLGKALLDFRETHAELYHKMHALGCRFYQQPAGFEDAVLTQWKIEEQAKMWGQTLSLKDLWAGYMCETSRKAEFAHNQVQSKIRAKITAMCQVTDTHVTRPVKLKKLQKDIDLRRELIKLAEMEETHIVFKCGMYEVMRTLHECVSELKKEWDESGYLLRAMYQNGWLSLRPNIKKGELERSADQPWCEGFKFGSHRIRASWSDQRFDHLGEKNVPKDLDWKKHEEALELEEEQTYMVEDTYGFL